MRPLVQGMPYAWYVISQGHYLPVQKNVVCRSQWVLSVWRYPAYHLTRRPQLPSHDKPVTLR
ncbi:Hypothetical protein GbCGDNIH6_8208 [Granulibacter bethesdensis]|nr:Hypothetical protein GbCGDNIH6_8208 [Granulibacter bethesdensis]